MADDLRATAHGRAAPFDVLVIGAGITGAGTALDAAHRGLRTALVERDDFASGTSSKSSKMVHGGLRYLQAGDVRLVYEALRERQRLRRNARHLVDTLPFLIPVMTRDGVVSKKLAKALNSALWMYDLTGGWRIGKLHRRLNAQQAADHFPTTTLERLSGGFLYYDASADDARLTLAIAQTAADHGATVLNRCAVRNVERRSDGFDVTLDIDGESVTVPTRAVVNATGVWADTIGTDDDAPPTAVIRPAKGVHLTVPWELVRVDVAVIIPVRRDKRSLFLVPWGEYPDGTFSHVYIGTTDTDYDGPLDDPPVTTDDVDYVLTALNDALDTERVRQVTVDDVTAVWSGLRPLVDRPTDSSGNPTTADLSRRHAIDVSAAGIISILGGKLTTYREMAEDTVDVVMQRLGRPERWWRRLDLRRRTVGLRLAGSSRPPNAPRGSTEHHLWSRYGARTDDVRALIAAHADLGERLVPGYPYLRAEVVYAVRSEMATTLHDVLSRRTRLQLFDRCAALDAAPVAADLMAGELQWDEAQRTAQIDDFRAWSEREWVSVLGQPAPQRPPAHMESNDASVVTN